MPDFVLSHIRLYNPYGRMPIARTQSMPPSAEHCTKLLHNNRSRRGAVIHSPNSADSASLPLCGEIERPRVASLPEQECDQITHLLLADRGFKTIRHQRPVQALHVLDGTAGEGFFDAAGHGEDEGVGGFALDEAGEGAAVFGLDGVGAPAGFEHAVGIKDVAEEGFGGLDLHVGERRADIDAELAVLVAGDADGGEELLAFFGVAGLFRGVEIAGDDLGPVGVGLAEEFFGEFGHFALPALETPAFFDIDPRGRELAFFHALEQVEGGGGVGDEDGDEFAFERGAGFGQEFVNQRRGAGGGEFLQQRDGGGGGL
jgi:hypothetical protein